MAFYRQHKFQLKYVMFQLHMDSGAFEACSKNNYNRSENDNLGFERVCIGIADIQGLPASLK